MSVINDILRYAGVGPQYRGYRYLSHAVELALQCGTYDIQMTKAIYPEVAKRFQTAVHNVERDIRTAVRRAWETGGQEAMSSLVGYRVEHRPTNMVFVCLIVEALHSGSLETGSPPSRNLAFSLGLGQTQNTISNLVDY